MLHYYRPGIDKEMHDHENHLQTPEDLPPADSDGYGQSKWWNEQQAECTRVDIGDLNNRCFHDVLQDRHMRPQVKLLKHHR